MTGEEAVPFPDTSPITDASNIVICQLDAAVLVGNNAIIGSKKTRVLPRHVVELASMIDVVKANRSSVKSLSPFIGKTIYGEGTDITAWPPRRHCIFLFWERFIPCDRRFPSFAPLWQGHCVAKPCQGTPRNAMLWMPP